MNKIEIYTEYIPLDSFLKFCGVVSSGSEAKFLIKQGLISVNGEICTQRGKKLYNRDIVTLKDNDNNLNFMVEKG